MEWLCIIFIVAGIIWVGIATDHEEYRRDRERRGIRDDD